MLVRKVYESCGYYVISENGVWITGAYIDRETAMRAFEYPDYVLQSLMNTANDRAGGSGGVITAEDLDGYGGVVEAAG